MSQPLPVSIQLVLTDEEYGLFAGLIYSLSGINLGSNKKELVKARLMKRMRALGLESYRRYYEYVLADKTGAEVESLLNAVSTNVTSFFRESQHFSLLSSVVIPEIERAKQRKAEKSLRIWSCASSSGEEIYSILMTVCEALRIKDFWDIKVLGTDISTRALEAARRAEYSPDRARGIPPHYLERYFDRTPGGYTVKKRLRDMAVFGRLNLMRESYPFQGKFDAIFCRNVMIYFDKETQAALVERLYRYLEPGGYLFIGHSESLLGSRIRLMTIAPAAFRKPLLVPSPGKPAPAL